VGLFKKLMMKILHLEKDAYPNFLLKDLEDQNEIIYLDCNSQIELNQFLDTNKVDVIFTKLGLHIGAEQFKMQPHLKYIVTPTTGLNHIDFEIAKKNGIEIISLKGQFDFLKNIKSTAEHTWLLLLAISRNLYPVVHNVKKNKIWDRKPYIADELNNKKLGIVGFGRLGKIISEYGKAFGMKILAYDIDRSKYNDLEIEFKSNLDDLLEQSDFIVLLISWSKENINLFDSSKFNKFKKESYFINTSRGEFIDSNALIDALLNKKIKGAAIDVIDGDSVWESGQTISNNLVDYASKYDNLIITPHMGGYGKDSIENTRKFVTQLFLNIIK
jgi:D-3-phosphoglycerate dehydrogenase